MRRAVHPALCADA
ncbi:Putative uncharacterized protein [Escherichia coli D6-117.29]|nr:Protein of unknown function [Escherichia coli]CDP77752.1 Putative uncharacterized protein [Escherichia coli D6-117.29]CDU39869.1 Protein of unknown function [Escherichia coli]